MNTEERKQSERKLFDNYFKLYSVGVTKRVELTQEEQVNLAFSLPLQSDLRRKLSNRQKTCKKLLSFATNAQFQERVLKELKDYSFEQDIAVLLDEIQSLEHVLKQIEDSGKFLLSIYGYEV